MGEMLLPSAPICNRAKANADAFAPCARGPSQQPPKKLHTANTQHPHTLLQHARVAFASPPLWSWREATTSSSRPSEIRSRSPSACTTLSETPLGLTLYLCWTKYENGARMYVFEIDTQSRHTMCTVHLAVVRSGHATSLTENKLLRVLRRFVHRGSVVRRRGGGEERSCGFERRLQKVLGEEINKQRIVKAPVEEGLELARRCYELGCGSRCLRCSS